MCRYIQKNINLLWICQFKKKDLAVNVLFLSIMTIRLFERNRTLTFIVMYSLYLYFLGLSLRNTSNALEPFKDQQRSHVVYGTGYKGLVHRVRSITNIEELSHS